MSEAFTTVSPVDGRVYVERPFAGYAEVERALALGDDAAGRWKRVPLEDRAAAVARWVDHLVAESDTLAEELTWQMGRPIAQAPSELGGFETRARTMIRLAPDALADTHLAPSEGLARFIRREPLGLVLVLAPWNYPWLTSVNAVAPALLAGNAVLLKHSEQTPLVAERMSAAAREAGLPEGVLAHVHMANATTAAVVADRRVAFVCFTGSVEGGRAVQRAAAGRFVGVGLELGGNDPAYVCEDAPVAATAAAVADGAFYNAGQSCCAIERVYVQRDRYDAFVDALCTEARALRLGDPRERATTLGPMVRVSNAARVEAQVAGALRAGARDLLDDHAVEGAARGLPYLAPRVIVDVDERVELMREESFGPVVAVAPVRDDDEAVARMNDSRYGLTASVWTSDEARARHIGDRIDTGTVYMNRCDTLDPELPWVGVKDSGRGCSLSHLGFAQLTRPKSFYLRRAP
ncbi:MAG: aldehyde dehydrogenase family protein [Myxococcales bacterium]|nr:aldehyde dehydrogenase family protein [Myxococcales bacterium]